MDDLISRQAAIDALDGELTITGRENAKTILDYVNGVDKKLRELAQKGEIKRVKHGQWIIKKDVTFPHMVCSECKKSFYGNMDDEWDYCPHCGAKMNKILT